MKLLTLNTHSLHGGDWEQKLEWFVQGILEEKPDIIALQEVIWAGQAFMKSSNGIITLDNVQPEVQECIKCGRCVDVCPMELKPLHYFKLVGAQDWQGCKDMNIMDCMECRCCEYICSSKLPLVTMIKMGKNGVRGLK